MSASIRASCPGCRKLIRIPLDWSDRAMKCKRCGMLVQMKRKAASPEHVESAVAPSLGFEPNYEEPVYSLPLPPVPEYVPPPVAPLPYGYPSPFPMPAMSQYAMPQAAYPPPPAPTAEVASFNTEEYTPSRRRYQPKQGSGLQMVIALGVVAAVIAGCVYIGMKMGGSLNEEPGSATTVETGKPKTNPPASGGNTLPGTPPTPISSEPFPRRMLFVNISKYVFFNNLAVGNTRSTGAKSDEDLSTYTAKMLAGDLRVPTDLKYNQLFVMSDTAVGAPPMLRNVLLQTFEQFFNTCREQDRIVLYLGGHVREVGEKAYLVPVDGDPDDVATLLPLAEVYSRLEACKAQQKIVMWDVCRFNEGMGSSRGGSEKMSETLQTLLHAVKGVQVLTSCSAGQHAQETVEGGSEFLKAFRVKGRELRSSPALVAAKPDQPLPIEKWNDAVREYLASDRTAAARQIVKATMPALDAAKAVAYSKDAAPAARFPWPAAPPGASPAEVSQLIALLDLPGLRSELVLPAGLAEVYPFKADVMKDDNATDVSDEESIKGDKYPLRKATVDAMIYMRENWKFGNGDGMRESLSGAVDDNVKKQIAKDQIPIAVLEEALETHMKTLETLGKKLLAQEKSKRWQALYAYALAQVQMRYAFACEYNLVLGNIKTDSLEVPKGGGAPVYRLVSGEKMRSKKDYAEAARDGFETIAKTHKGTPLEILAKMNRNVALGLSWKLEIQDAPMTDEKKN